MDFKKIVVAGGGVLGSQIAYQCAYCGYDVMLLVRAEDDQDKIIKTLYEIKNNYLGTLELMKDKKDWARGIVGDDDFNYEKSLTDINNSLSHIKIATSQEVALKDADLLIESITENIKIKEIFYEQVSKFMEEKTIVVTNSSTLLPSKMAKYTGRPDRFLAMHFANNIYKNNMVEIMTQEKTNLMHFNTIVEFAKSMKMIPLEVKSEKSGYLLNSMLVPFLLSAMDLYANGISDPETIDRAWKLGTGAPKGPFEIIDTVGLMTAKNIVDQYQKVPDLFDPLLRRMMLPYNYDGMLKILNKYIDEGKLGKSTKEGFYKYD